MANVFRTCLLLALLALGGEALAQPCHDDAQVDMGVSAPEAQASNTDHLAGSTHQPASSSHCSNRSCEESAATGAPHDCDNACNCCPGHCANALPGSGATTEFPVSNQSSTDYRPLDSSPAPESDIRPPIAA